MLGQVVVGIGRCRVGVAIDEAGAVVDVGRSCGVPGQGGVEAGVEGVALVVIDGGVVEAGVA